MKGIFKSDEFLAAAPHLIHICVVY